MRPSVQQPILKDKNVIVQKKHDIAGKKLPFGLNYTYFNVILMGKNTA
jgi:hypothetical protein